MIDIIATEAAIESILNEVNLSTAHKFKIIKYPGSLEELGKPLNCLQVVVRFKNISFQERSSEFMCKCYSQVNTASWSLDFYSINPRDYHKIIELAEDVIRATKNKKVGVLEAGDTINRVSPLYLSNFGFVSAENGFVYQFSSDISFQYTDRLFC